MRLLSVKWKPRFEYQNFQRFVTLNFSKSKILRMRLNKSCCNKALNAYDTEHILSPTDNECTATSLPNNLVLISCPLHKVDEKLIFALFIISSMRCSRHIKLTCLKITAT